MNKVQTINLKGNEYALVPQRLKAFREANPRASVETDPVVKDDGTIIYKAVIVADISKPDSPRATGHAYGKLGEAKAFEKLETNAVGRALSLLGYLNNGQIASTEEMQEFEEYQLEKIIEEIHAAQTRKDFQDILAKLDPAKKREVTPIINQRIKEMKEQENAQASTS